jgi:hypothetical protein
MKVETESLAQVDPFKLLMRGLPSNKLSLKAPNTGGDRSDVS